MHPEVARRVSEREARNPESVSVGEAEPSWRPLSSPEYLILHNSCHYLANQGDSSLFHNTEYLVIVEHRHLSRVDPSLRRRAHLGSFLLWGDRVPVQQLNVFIRIGSFFSLQHHNTWTSDELSIEKTMRAMISSCFVLVLDAERVVDFGHELWVHWMQNFRSSHKCAQSCT